ncbi:hypothetical protein IMCC9480_3139 [Oxalobacteraceae bacterium IMCC9480]|nr:hypothetical protein IMCC9480_3139 [Oxalobacteraceae bacterium IMCC9480]
MLQAARAMQKSVLVDATNKDATKAVSLQIDAALDCVSSVFRQADNLAASSKVSEKIEAITANTKQRLVAYLAYNKSQDGTTSSLARGDTCE